MQYILVLISLMVCCFGGEALTWTEWSEWACPVTCGDGTQTRSRTIVNTTTDEIEEMPCPGDPCPIDGGWTAWSQWSSCDVTCSAGNEIRTRTCTNPPPQYGGQDCLNADTFQGRPCFLDPCPIDGLWHPWSDWSECSEECGTGYRIQNRVCLDPQFGGAPCSGPYNMTEICNTNPCPVDGLFEPWSDWSACNVSCAGGLSIRQRICFGPFYGGFDCNGTTIQDRICNTQPCPIDGGWSEWISWSECTKTCNWGTKARSRDCNNPVPQYGGLPCPAKDSQTQKCYITVCPQDGNWGEWTPWSLCTLSCGWGTRHKARSCDDPPPLNGGIYCIGSSAAAESCQIVPCPVYASWSNWGAWMACSKTCGSGGQYVRTRECDSPPALFGGQHCHGNDTVKAECYVERCEEDGGWSDWSIWSECSEDCETGIQTRNHSCNNPAPTPSLGEFCRGEFNETRECNTHICPGVIADNSTNIT